jgi:hypothetical protein
MFLFSSSGMSLASVLDGPAFFYFLAVWYSERTKRIT